MFPNRWSVNGRGARCFRGSMGAVCVSGVSVWWMALWTCGLSSATAEAAESSIVGRGIVKAQIGWKQPQRTGPQPLLKQPPEMTPPRRAAICAGECERLDRPPYIVPEAKGPSRFGYPKPGRQVQIRGLATDSSAAQAPAAPGDLRVWRTSNVNVSIPAGSSAAISTTNEPSLAVNQDVVFAAGNWYAGLSPDLGLTWAFIDPYDNFPADGTLEAPGSSSGFCCDQVVYYEPSRDLMIWLLQYATPRDAANNRTAMNVQRLAWAVGRQNLLNNNWSWIDFDPTTFGFTNQNWLDFPDLQTTNNSLYYTTGVFPLTSGTSSAGVMVRMSLDDLQNGTPVQFSYINSGHVTRMCSGCSDIMWAGIHVDTDTLRIWRYGENSSSATFDDVDHVAFNPVNTGAGQIMVATGPDGTNWAGFCDNRVLAGYRTDGEVGFMYGSRQNPPGFPYPYVDVSKFEEANLAYRGTEAVYNTQYGILYPSCHVNAGFARGGTFAFGGPSNHPSVAAYIVDSYVGWDFTQMSTATVATGGAGPSGNRWGDYLTVRLGPLNANTWLASGFTMPNATTVQPMNVWFSREEHTPPAEVMVRSVLVEGGQCHSSGTSMTVNVTLRNLGMSQTTIPLVNCRISTDTTIDAGDTEFGSASNVVINADQELVVPITAIVPYLPHSIYWLGVVLPFFGDQIQENNRALFPSVLGIGPAPAPAPVVLTEPNDVAVCPGSNVVLLPTTESYFPNTHLWSRNGGFYSTSTTTDDVLIVGAQRTDSGVYRLSVTNQCGTTLSREAIVAVGVFIRNQPQNQSVAPCGSASFSLLAYGVGPLSYQWRYKGVPLVNDGRITGVNTPTLTVNSAVYDDEGTYDCVVTDNCGPIASAAATLTLPTPNWTLRSDIAQPPSRSGSALTYDSNRGVHVFYGGGSLVAGTTYADHWEYDGVEWVKRTPPQNPGGRFKHAMVYDIDRQRVYLLGGNHVPQNVFESDLWEFDGTTWTLRKPATDPDNPPFWVTSVAPRLKLAYDSARKRVVGVMPIQSQALNSSTWEYDPAANTWSQRVASNGFPGGYWNSMAFDPLRGKTVHYQNESGPRQTWRWDGNVWIQDSVTSVDLFQSLMAHDAQRGRLVLFFGYRFGPKQETYYDTNPDWTLLLPGGPPTGPPTDVACYHMTWDSRRRAMVALMNNTSDVDHRTPLELYEYRYLDRVVFDQQPKSQPLTQGTTATFRVYAAGRGTLTYQWKRNGQNIADGPAPGGGSFSGTNTSTLTITNVGQADATVYSCAVSNACGAAVSDAALLGTLPMDFDADFDVDGADVDAFTACAAGANVPLTPECLTKDLDGDQDADPDDFGILQRCFSGQGRPPKPGCSD